MFLFKDWVSEQEPLSFLNFNLQSVKGFVLLLITYALSQTWAESNDLNPLIDLSLPSKWELKLSIILVVLGQSGIFLYAKSSLLLPNISIIMFLANVSLGLHCFNTSFSLWIKPLLVSSGLNTCSYKLLKKDRYFVSVRILRISLKFSK